MSDTGSSPPVSYRKPAAAEPPAKPAAPSALDQLQASRARVRSELERIAHPPAKPSLFSQGGDLEDKVKRFLLGLPGVAYATQVAQSWWAAHPVRQAAVQAAGTWSQTAVQPVAARYPRGLLVVSAAIGAALVLARPWRWLLHPGVILGAGKQLIADAMRRRA